MTIPLKKVPLDIEDEGTVMITPTDLRQEFIRKAQPLVDEYVGAALGTSELRSTNAQARHAVWETLQKIIEQADDAIKSSALTSPDTAKKIEGVLAQVANGELTPRQAKDLMALITAGFEVTDVQKLMSVMEEIKATGIKS